MNWHLDVCIYVVCNIPAIETNMETPVQSYFIGYWVNMCLVRPLCVMAFLLQTSRPCHQTHEIISPFVEVENAASHMLM